MNLDTYILWVVGKKLLVSGILNFSPPPAPRGATPNLARSAEMTNPERGAYMYGCLLIITKNVVND